MLVFPDVDLEQAVRWGGHRGILSNQGQICCATSRMFVHEDTYHSCLERYLDEVAEIWLRNARADYYGGPRPAAVGPG